MSMSPPSVQLPTGFQPHLHGINIGTSVPYIADPKFVFPGSGTTINSVAGTTAATTTVNTVPGAISTSVPITNNEMKVQNAIHPAEVGKMAPTTPPGGPVRVTVSNVTSPVQVV